MADVPPGVVTVTSQGLVRVKGQGTARITVTVPGTSGSSTVEVTVTEAAEKPLHFRNDIVPLLTRHGCNSGGCHGKASGQNGFKLSLFGFDSDFDYHALVHEARGRRLFPASPENSLLLIKATGKVSGTIRYGQIEIECGGQISGDIQAQVPGEMAETIPDVLSVRAAG